MEYESLCVGDSKPEFKSSPYLGVVTTNNIGMLSGESPLLFNPEIARDDALYIKALIDTRGTSEFLIDQRIREVVRDIRVKGGYFTGFSILDGWMIPKSEPTPITIEEKPKKKVVKNKPSRSKKWAGANKSTRR